MAYVEVWKSGKFITRRSVDEQKAQKGCKIRLGSAGEVHLAIGQSETIGEFEVRVFAGDPPQETPEPKQEASELQKVTESQLPLDFSAGASYLSDNQGEDKQPEIEGYKIIERLGRGGMGMVWLAEQLSTKRQVALKLMVSHAIDSQKAQARFQREVELTARLDNPNIARIYDSGLHQGMYFYAMELIDGLPLDKYVKDYKLTQKQILMLMRTICHALLYAHLRGVIHRDLKPSNIMVDSEGQPHILDFGLAKALLEDDESLTVSIEGQITGTPAYMAPEQAAGRHSETDTRTDVFSLGVILYELLTGQSPHDLSGSMFDVLHNITEGNIQRPSQINKKIDRELEAIILKALSLDPEKRYASGGALGKDIGNYLDEEPLDAPVPTTLYFVRKKTRKYRVHIGIALAILAVVIFIYTKAIEQRAEFRATEKELEIQVREAKLAGEKAEWAELELKILGNDKEEARAALRALRDEYRTAQDNVNKLQERLEQSRPPVRTKRIDLKPGESSAPTALVRKPALPAGVQSWTIETLGHRGRINKIAYSPDGRWLASSGSDGTIRLWDCQSGQLSAILADPNGYISDLAWSADGQSIVTVNPLGQRRSWLWDSQIQSVQLTSDISAEENLSLSIPGRSWSQDSNTPSRNIDEIISSWEINLPNGRKPLQQAATCITLSPDGNTLAFGDHEGVINFLDVKSSILQHASIPSWCGPVGSVAFSAKGDTFATCSGTGTICLWDAHKWEPINKFQAASITENSSDTGVFAWGPDGNSLALARGRDGSLTIIDSQSGRVLRTLESSGQRITSIAWSVNGSTLAAGTSNSTILIWDLRSISSGTYRALAVGSSNVKIVFWTDDGQSLISADEDGKVRLWDLRKVERSISLAGHTEAVTSIAVAPDRKTAASASKDKTVRLWDLQSAQIIRTLRGEPNRPVTEQWFFSAVAWSPKGDFVAAGDSTGNIHIWDSDSRKLLYSFQTNCVAINSLAWSSDGQFLVCGGSDGTARAWDVKDTYKEFLTLLPLWGSAGPGIAINPEGDYRGIPGVAEHLIYVIKTEVSQRLLSAQSFANQYGWVNEPWQVGLHKSGSEIMRRIYVKADAQGPYDGNSWETAFNELQDALNVAESGSEIWVTAGIYKPDRGTGSREASFELKNGVALYGGFAGSETRRYERDPNVNETILSGDLKGNDGPDFLNNDENSYHVVYSRDKDETAVLDGFFITNGNANGPMQKDGDYGFFQTGGGMYNTRSEATINNCIFKYNFAFDGGGGMYNINCRGLRITHCNFFYNRTELQPPRRGGGGGIHNRYGKVIIMNCTFANNSSQNGGGVDSSSEEEFIYNCTFINNSADKRGGGISAKSRKQVIRDCTFINNSARQGGGGIDSDKEGELSLINCRFISNSSQGGGGGGVINNRNSLIGTNCIFIGNKAIGGGATLNRENRYFQTSSTWINCTFVANTSIMEELAIENDPNGNLNLTNCIIWNNKKSGEDPSNSDKILSRTGPINIDNCCVQNWRRKTFGKRNFRANPMFVDIDGPDNIIGTEDDDLRLGPASPYINTGDNSTLPPDTFDLDGDGDPNELIPFDIENNPRILNGTVDIGAYESG